ncbi:putative ATP-dependent RNA helicase DDX59 [Glycine soja]|uniref:uncharacterized protein LOC114412160 isoform X1 n=1 Tax=Glycine soja TaxID=3848 RepID=UPI00103BB0D2|nr:uncharacterized protein LOC114412160 isoform X1 [Glycine soja]KAH1249062.1 putative ATP-dependent RNA helicase DDX59 [Glycine max]
MGTRTNFYKNPSISYKKRLSISSVLQNLHAYNIAAGNVPPADPPQATSTANVPPSNPPHLTPSARLKRSRNPEPPEFLREYRDDAPSSMSHHDYIQNRSRDILFLTRKEVVSSRNHDRVELTEEVLGNSNSTLPLVDYDASDEDTPSECEETHTLLNSGQQEEFDGVKKSRNQQRFPVSGEPVCLICGRYGEYICNETDDDVCSMECKSELLEILKLNEGSSHNQVRDISSSGISAAVPVPVFGDDTWDYNQHHWSKKTCSLSTYECWKCQRPGHLAEDCMVTEGSNRSSSIPKDLLQLYRRCHQIGKDLLAANCNVCRRSSNLATCLDCSIVLCDGAGHLIEHIRTHPSHQKYYSHKLKRLVKCCKSTCKVTDIKDLLVCHYCFDKAFEKFYDMYTATWKGAGLAIMWGSICCEDHFTWHRMNCLNANVEESAYILKPDGHKGKRTQLSDFIF